VQLLRDHGSGVAFLDDDVDFAVAFPGIVRRNDVGTQEQVAACPGGHQEQAQHDQGAGECDFALLPLPSALGSATGSPSAAVAAPAGAPGRGLVVFVLGERERECVRVFVVEIGLACL